MIYFKRFNFKNYAAFLSICIPFCSFFKVGILYGIMNIGTNFHSVGKILFQKILWHINLGIDESTKIGFILLNKVSPKSIVYVHLQLINKNQILFKTLCAKVLRH
jgi:hypothetical protein